MSAAKNRFSVRRAFYFSLPFILMGVVALATAVYGVATRQLNAKESQHLLTVIVACIGIPLVIFGWFGSKRPKAAQELKAVNPEKPWKWRADWAAGRVDNAERRSIFFLWVSVLLFNLVSLVGLVILLNLARHGKPTAWLGVMFPVIGVTLLVFAARTTRIWGRFGRSALFAAGLPVAPGNVLAGEIQVPARLQPVHAFYLRLSCIRRTVGQRGKTRVTTERILWQEEKWYRPNLPQPVAGATRIPVYFQLPASLPESTLGAGDGVQWRLEAEASVSGPDFRGLYDVPVFKTENSVAAGTLEAPAAVPVVAAAPPDPDLPYQLTLDEVRKEIHSRIQVVDQPEGREVIFPAGRNPGFASAATALWLVWTAAVVLMVVLHAPVILPMVFAVVDVLMGIFMCDLWLRTSSVLATPTQLKLKTNWLTLKKEIVLQTAEIASLKADIGATAVHTAYYDLKIRTRDGRDIIAAKFLSHKPEADWLIRQIVERLKRASAPPETATQP